MEVLPTENHGTLYSSPVDTSDTVEIGLLTAVTINPLNAELNPICHLLALLGAHHFLHVSRIRVNLSFFRNMMQYRVVLSAALKDDTWPASHLGGPDSIAGEFI